MLARGAGVGGERVDGELGRLVGEPAQVLVEAPREVVEHLFHVGVRGARRHVLAGARRQQMERHGVAGLWVSHPAKTEAASS